MLLSYVRWQYIIFLYLQTTLYKSAQVTVSYAVWHCPKDQIHLIETEAQVTLKITLLYFHWALQSLYVSCSFLYISYFVLIISHKYICKHVVYVPLQKNHRIQEYFIPWVCGTKENVLPKCEFTSNCFSVHCHIPYDRLAKNHLMLFAGVLQYHLDGSTWKNNFFVQFRKCW